MRLMIDIDDGDGSPSGSVEAVVAGVTVASSHRFAGWLDLLAILHQLIEAPAAGEGCND